MQILPKTNRNFDQLAEKVASGFLTDSVPLTDGVVKVAKDLQLNPEECRRLMEKTNTIATVKMLRATLNKKADYQLADIDAVLAQTHPTATEEEKIAAEGDVPDRLPDCRTADRYRNVTFPKLEKRASEKGEDPLVTIFTTEKRIEELTRQKLAKEMQVQDRIDYIISEFSRWKGPDFGKFANEAVTVYGRVAEPVLVKMAEYLEEPQEFEKVAYVVDDSQAIIDAMGTVVEGLNDILELSHNLKDSREALTAAWSKAKNAD